MSKNSYVRKVGDVLASAQRIALGSDINWEIDEFTNASNYMDARNEIKKLAAACVNTEAEVREINSLLSRRSQQTREEKWETGDRCYVLTEEKTKNLI